MKLQSAPCLLSAAVAIVAAILGWLTWPLTSTPVSAPLANSIYEFTAVDIKGRDVRIGDLTEGKVALIVNTASKCGFTHVYNDLQRLYEKYGQRGFVVLG